MMTLFMIKVFSAWMITCLAFLGGYVTTAMAFRRATNEDDGFGPGVLGGTASTVLVWAGLLIFGNGLLA